MNGATTVAEAIATNRRVHRKQTRAGLARLAQAFAEDGFGLDGEVIRLAKLGGPSFLLDPKKYPRLSEAERACEKIVESGEASGVLLAAAQARGWGSDIMVEAILNYGLVRVVIR